MFGSMFIDCLGLQEWVFARAEGEVPSGVASEQPFAQSQPLELELTQDAGAPEEDLAQ